MTGTKIPINYQIDDLAFKNISMLVTLAFLLVRITNCNLSTIAIDCCNVHETK